ncbi:MAG: hypothetical protein NTU63_01660 [Candidatus Pacearchaeota archaeon]|nr:hypothetical protein [Candidatus Pacearchaeota archaeon]
MKYTVSKEADKKIEKDIEIIKKVILNEIKPEAIILFGGFGHGGGSFKKIRGKIVPLNDYDLYVITKRKTGENTIKELEERCAGAINRGGLEIVEKFNGNYDINQFFHVDLHFIELRKLKKLYPTQRTFDLKTSLVIYSNEKILDKIPEIKISKSDAIRLLFNKIDHFSIAEGNSKEIKSIYAVKGLTDLCSALLIFEGKYVSRYQDREKIFKSLNVPEELKRLVSLATKAKLYHGYETKETDKLFEESKKWVEWTLKKIIREHLKIKSENWKEICRIVYKRLPYRYFNDYLNSEYLFFGQYYLNIRFFIAGLKKKETLLRSLLRWRDSGLIIAISLLLYSFNEKEEAKKYLRKLTKKTEPLRERILKLYSIYYLQKLV